MLWIYAFFASYTSIKENILLELSIKDIFTIDMVTLMGCNCIENILKIDFVAFIDCQNMTCLKCTLTS